MNWFLAQLEKPCYRVTKLIIVYFVVFCKNYFTYSLSPYRHNVLVKKNGKLTSAQKCKEYRKQLSRMERLEKRETNKRETNKQLKQNKEVYKKHLQKDQTKKQSCSVTPLIPAPEPLHTSTLTSESSPRLNNQATLNHSIKRAASALPKCLLKKVKVIHKIISDLSPVK